MQWPVYWVPSGGHCIDRFHCSCTYMTLTMRLKCSHDRCTHCFRFLALQPSRVTSQCWFHLDSPSHHRPVSSRAAAAAWWPFPSPLTLTLDPLRQIFWGTLMLFQVGRVFHLAPFMLTYQAPPLLWVLSRPLVTRWALIRFCMVILWLLSVSLIIYMLWSNAGHKHLWLHHISTHDTLQVEDGRTESQKWKIPGSTEG